MSHKPETHSWSAAIARVAAEKNLSGGEIARRVGWHNNDVLVRLNGRRETSTQAAELFAKALGVSLAELASKSKLNESGIFHDRVVREVAKKVPLTLLQRNQIVRFINERAPRKATA